MTLPPPSESVSKVRKGDLIFGVIVPGILFGPFLMFGLLGGILTVATSDTPMQKSSLDFIGIVAVMIVAAALALTALGLTVVMGPEKVARKPWLRMGIVVSLLGGIAVAGYVLWAQRSGLQWSLGKSGKTTALWSLIPALVALAGPIVVAARYLPSLVRGSSTR